jgi:hypothetical protein
MIGAFSVSLYSDWVLVITNDSFTGAFVAAPIGGILWAFAACGLRLAVQYIMARVKGHRFDALDRPLPHFNPTDAAESTMEQEAVVEHRSDVKTDGKFF